MGAVMFLTSSIYILALALGLDLWIEIEGYDVD